jgi:hypothetical protein
MTSIVVFFAGSLSLSAKNLVIALNPIGLKD